MSKVTKKQLQRDINNLATELTNLKIELLEKKVISDEPKPQLKQLDQSVFPLIERESVELTGSDLCRAMIIGDRDWVLAYVSNENDATALFHKNAMVVTDFDLSEDAFYCRGENFAYAVPVNNQGEPLTASEVGL